MTTSSLPLVAHQVAVSHDEETVLLELICKDAYGACVLYDDVLSRLQSERGLHLFVQCKPIGNGGATE